MNEVARILEMPPMRVYEVATFYTMYENDVFALTAGSIESRWESIFFKSAPPLHAHFAVQTRFFTR
jgi:Thioredoxin-like [2Fe-2S] ferredoxin